MPPKLNIKLQWQLLLLKSLQQQKRFYLHFVGIFIVPFLIHSYLLVELSAEGPQSLPKKSFTPMDLEMDDYKKYGADNPLLVVVTPNRPYFENVFERVKADLAIEYVFTDDKKEFEEKMRQRNKHMAGILFHKKGLHNRYMTELDMTLRFPAQLRREPDLTWETMHLLPFNIDNGNGPRNPKENDGGVPVGYLSEGFLQLQNSIALAFLTLSSGYEDLPTISIQRLPYPSYTHEPMCDSYSSTSMPSYIFLSFLYPVMYLTYMITKEKQRHLKEMIKISGIESLIHFSAWFVTSLAIMELVIIPLTILYKIQIRASFFPNSSWLTLHVFLTMYATALISLCIMTSTFFNNPRSAVYFLTSIYLFSNLLLRVVYDSLSLGEKLGYCALTNSAMNICCLLMRRLECSGMGVTRSNLFIPATISDNLPLGVIFMIFGIQSMAYFLIALYVDQINPGEFGIAKKWYYPFTAQFWCNRKEVLRYDERLKTLKQPNPRFFEDDSHTKRPIVVAKNLTRVLGRWVVVKNVSFDLYASEIAVLLGPAGSGKSVLMSLLVGTRLPHVGTALILGKDIRYPPQEACRHVGVCFGECTLWDNLTAEEHFKFYSKMKSLKGTYNEEEIDRFIELLHLGHEAEVPIGRLKIGLKRRIMICNALCGNVNVLICEDPTVGLDPDSRLEVWNLLRAVKKGRAILVTTESLYEAEMLSDRIAIMCDGELKCFGTKFFLKKLYGSGHRLICLKKENCDVLLVSDVLRPYIPDVRPIRNTDTEIVYNLPDRYLPQFGEILKALEAEAEELRLETFTIETASMEEVYMSAGGDTYYEDGSTVRLRPRPTNTSTNPENDVEGGTAQGPQRGVIVSYMRRYKGCALLGNQWKAMFLKKFLLSYNSKMLVFIQIFLPAIVLVLRLYLFGGAYNPFKIEKMTFSVDQYSDMTVVLEVDESVANDSFEHELVKKYTDVIDELGGGGELAHYHVQDLEDTTISEYFMEQTPGNQSEIDRLNLIACTIKKGEVIAWMNNNALHTAPLSLNVLHNAMAKALLGDSAKILVSNFPQPMTEKLAHHRIEEHSNVIQNYLLSQIIVLSMYVLNPNSENVSLSKHLQFTCGVRIWIYWLSHLIWDFMSVTISTVFFTIAMALTEGYAIEKEMVSLFPVTLAFGFCVLSLTYILSFIFQRAATAFGVLVFFYYIGKLLVQNLIVTYHLEERYFFWFPFTAYAKACDSIQLVSIMERECDGKRAEVDADGICPMKDICCVHRDLVGWADPGILVESCWLLADGFFFFIVVLLLDYQVLKRLYEFTCNKVLVHMHKNEDSKVNKITSIVSKSTSRIGSKIKGLLTIKAQSKRKQREKLNRERRRQQNKKKFMKEAEQNKSEDEPIDEEDDFILFEDDDVLREKRNIKAMRIGDMAKRNLVVDRITKYYRGFLAIDSVSFQVRKRECFGIAGIPGSGKTTLMKTLISQIFPTSGDFYIRGQHVKFQPDSAKKEIGFCPQNDAFFKNLTGRENLKIFLLCRGIEWRNLNQFANELACTFQMPNILNSKSEFYGRGSRRKLSLAIAIIGPPAVLFFDEPTSNIDPQSKRRIWEVINKLRENSKSVVISSKNIDECESLCSRMAIMVNGKLMCMGSKQHLRDKYSQGCILTIKFDTELEEKEKKKEGETTEGEQTEEEKEDTTSKTSTLSMMPMKDIEDFVARKFPEAKLRQRLHGYRIYYIPNNDMKWSEMFETVEKYRKHLRIQDYSISQKSLEEIYLDFSKYQKTQEPN